MVHKIYLDYFWQYKQSNTKTSSCLFFSQPIESLSLHWCKFPHNSFPLPNFSVFPDFHISGFNTIQTNEPGKNVRTKLATINDYFYDFYPSLHWYCWFSDGVRPVKLLLQFMEVHPGVTRDKLASYAKIVSIKRQWQLYQDQWSSPHESSVSPRQLRQLLPLPSLDHSS